MKKLMFALFLSLTSLAAYSQSSPAKIEQVQMKSVGTIEIAAKVYPVYVGSRGGHYVNRVSKTGKAYKMYLTPEQRLKVKV